MYKDEYQQKRGDPMTMAEAVMLGVQLALLLILAWLVGRLGRR